MLAGARATPSRVIARLIRAGSALALAILLPGCSPSSFLARKMIQAPNRAPEFVKPKARMTIHWPDAVMESFTQGTNEVGDPRVPLRWVLIEPGDYNLHVELTLREDRGRKFGEFRIQFRLPDRDGPPPSALGTVFILHGYGVDLGMMLPWGLYLAEAGWRSVLVDLRGHGHSGGRRVSFGLLETEDLRDLLRQLEEEGRIHGPHVALGHSLGGAIALRWQAADPAIEASIALGALSEFGPAAHRLRDEYASWVPRAWLRGALRRLPNLLHVPPPALDTTHAIRGSGVKALLIAGDGDRITPPSDSAAIRELLDEGSDLLIVGPISHEALPFLFEQHGPAVVEWLSGAVDPVGTHHARHEGSGRVATGHAERAGACAAEDPPPGGLP